MGRHPHRRTWSRLRGPTSTQTYVWSNGKSRTITFNSTVATVGGQTVLRSDGTVDSGAFAGAAVERAITLVADLTACLQEPGLTSAGGPEVLADDRAVSLRARSSASPSLRARRRRS